MSIDKPKYRAGNEKLTLREILVEGPATKEVKPDNKRILPRSLRVTSPKGSYVINLGDRSGLLRNK